MRRIYERIVTVVYDISGELCPLHLQLRGISFESPNLARWMMCLSSILTRFGSCSFTAMPSRFPHGLSRIVEKKRQMMRSCHSLLAHGHALWQYVDDLLAWLDKVSSPLWASLLVVLLLNIPKSLPSTEPKRLRVMRQELQDGPCKPDTL